MQNIRRQPPKVRRESASPNREVAWRRAGVVLHGLAEGGTASSHAAGAGQCAADRVGEAAQQRICTTSRSKRSVSPRAPTS
eukprot:3288753-Prymnesium_polylepis.1